MDNEPKIKITDDDGQEVTSQDITNWVDTVRQSATDDESPSDEVETTVNSESVLPAEVVDRSAERLEKLNQDKTFSSEVHYNSDILSDTNVEKPEEPAFDDLSEQDKANVIAAGQALDKLEKPQKQKTQYPDKLIKELRRYDRKKTNKTCAGCATRKPLKEMQKGKSELCDECRG